MKCVGSEINMYSNKKYWQQYEEMVHRKTNRNTPQAHEKNIQAPLTVKQIQI